MLLSEILRPCKLRVKKIYNLNTNRLFQFGISEDEEIEVLYKNKKMFIIKVAHSLFAVNIEWAKNIMVEAI